MYTTGLYDGAINIKSDGFDGLIYKVSNEICDALDMIYSPDDIKSMYFHLKGHKSGIFSSTDITAFLVRVHLNFIESDDVIEVVHDRMSKIMGSSVIPEGQSGLSFMSISKSRFGSDLSELSFWYEFSNKEERFYQRI